jgi:hypothetical protein
MHVFVSSKYRILDAKALSRQLEACLIVREDVYCRMDAVTAIDHSDRSLYEFGEFHPDR